MQKDPRDTLDISFQYYLQRAASRDGNGEFPAGE
jgi:hypothetical protein